MIDYLYVLKKQPWLRLVNINNVSDRLLQRTKGSCFIAFNTIHGSYELHSVLNFDSECNSCNAVIDSSWLNQRIVEDYLMHNHKKFGAELQDTRDYIQSIYDKNEERRPAIILQGQMEILKRTLGRRV